MLEDPEVFRSKVWAEGRRGLTAAFPVSLDPESPSRRIVCESLTMWRDRMIGIQL